MRLRLAVLVGGLMAVTAVTAIAQRGFGGFGRKKKPEQPKEEAKADPAPSSAAPAGDSSAVLMEMTTEMSRFSSAAVDPSRFEPPSGFKKVESEMQKRKR